MSYLSLDVPVVVSKTLEYRLVSSDVEPTPADGYVVHPVPIEIPDVQVKLWLEYRLTE